MKRFIALLLTLPLLLSAPLGAQQEETYDYWQGQREMIQRGQQAIFTCNGLFTSNRTLQQVFDQELAYLRQPVGTAQGRNDTKIIRDDILFRGIENPTFYYLHSYFFKVNEDEKNTITSTCDYGGVKITSSIHKDNIFAVQFHPEKSQEEGLKLLNNFIDYLKK